MILPCEHFLDASYNLNKQQVTLSPVSIYTVHLKTPSNPGVSFPILFLLLILREKWVYWASAVLSHQSCLTLCDPLDSNPPGSSVHGIFQARILEWLTISFFRASSQPRNKPAFPVSPALQETWILYPLSHRESSTSYNFCSFVLKCGSFW